MLRRRALTLITLSLIIVVLLSACQSNPLPTASGYKSIVVTYSILGSVVKELAGDSANVTVLMPNGADPHEWEPSAKDIEAVNKADLVVQNGLALESGIQKTLAEAARRGVKTFSASDYIVIRKVGEGIATGDPDQAAGAEDPHLWTDPVAMKNVIAALAGKIKTDLGINADKRSIDLQARLDNLNRELTNMVSAIPPKDRKLVTGHESMGYFAQRYGFKLIGAIVPSITSQAEASAADLAALKKLIEDNQVKAIFTELGTSSAVSRAIGDETGIKVIELNTHTLPGDGSYFTFIRNLAKVIAEGLK